MYLHLGQTTVIRSETILGIFDLEKTTLSRTTRDYLAQATARGEVVNVSAEMPKSFVVTLENRRRTVYITQLAPATLLRRAELMQKNSLPEAAQKERV